ncbi:MAG: hypothetical protein ACREBU_08560, partial [Nitrososphaera sp.]
GMVSAEKTSEYHAEVTVEQQRRAGAKDHYVANSGLLTEHGSHHSYVSKSNKGLCFLLGDMKQRDFARKRVKTTMLKDGYGTGLYMERNGHFEYRDGKPKFKVDYARDKWVIEMKQLLHQLSAELDLEIHERIQAGKELRHLQGAVILGVMTDLLPLMCVCHSMASRNPNDKKRLEVAKRLNEAKEALRVAIVGNCAAPLPEVKV